MKNIKEEKRKFRHIRVRKNISGTSDRPRLCVHRSLKNLQAHLVNDIDGKVILGQSTLSKGIKDEIKNGGNVEAAKKLGKSIAKEAIDRGIKVVTFDRGGYIYHGRIKAFADAAREAGLTF